MSEDKFIRQSTIVDKDNLDQQNVLIVGLGAVGRQVADMLAATGVENVTICDFDEIEDHNCVTQLWKQEDIGKLKADVCAASMTAINPDCKPTVFGERWRPRLFKDMPNFTAIFNCVDSMDMRLRLFKYYDAKYKDFTMFDARIGGQQLEFYTVFDKDSREGYPGTICDDSEAYEEQGCHGVPMISFAAITGAAFLVQQFVSLVQGQTLYFKRGLAFPSSELYEL